MRRIPGASLTYSLLETRGQAIVDGEYKAIVLPTET
jgi:hypothetical protein